MKYDAFISYSSKNKATADAICHTLEENGVRCFIAPRDIPLGKKYGTVIVDAIKQSKVVVLVFSEQSATSPWVESEINVAFSNLKTIVPYKIDATLLNNYEEFYLMLNNRHWIESYPDYRERFKELVAAVTAVVGIKGAAPKPTAAPAPTPKPAPKPISKPTPVAPVQAPSPVVVPTPPPTPTPPPFPTNMPPVKKRHTWVWVVGVLLFVGVVWGVALNFLGSLGESTDSAPAEQTEVVVDKQESQTAPKSASQKKTTTESAKKSVAKKTSTPTTKPTSEAKTVATSQVAEKSATSSSNAQSSSSVAVSDFCEMVFVEGGTFTMGATEEIGYNAFRNEKPEHKVTVSSFYIGKYEVTQAQWEEIMGSTTSNWMGGNYPVEYVSWRDIQEFIRKLNQKTGKKYRLPTEAEWEYAAKGGRKSRGYKYSGSDNIDDVAWYNKVGRPHLVGQKRPNELGIYDMSGNVYEWCQDWYGDYSDASQTNPKGPSSGTFRVLRGGSIHQQATCSRVLWRHSITPSTRYSAYGFRLVRER